MLYTIYMVSIYVVYIDHMIILYYIYYGFILSVYYSYTLSLYQDCVATIPPIHTTLAIVVLILTLHRPFPTQTACGLYVLSSTSNVLCVP